jgi:hypothetical protein
LVFIFLFIFFCSSLYKKLANLPLNMWDQHVSHCMLGETELYKELEENSELTSHLLVVEQI